MNRTERLVAILLYLQSRRGDATSRATAGEMAAHFGVSRRTILRDLAALAAMEVPIDSTVGATGGYALAPDYALAPLPLSHREVLLLLVALDGLQRLPVAPFGDARATLAAKLRAMLSDGQRTVADRWRDKLSLGVPARPGHEAPFLDTLFAAAQTGTWLAVTYRSESKGEAVSYTLLLRQLTTQNGFWYCRAYSHERSAERTFRVDRFRAVEATTAPTTTNAISASETLPYEHDSHPQIQVKLTAAGVAVAETEQHVGHAVVRHADGSGALSLRCPPAELDYWARYFFRLAGNAQVVAPTELRVRIRALAEEIISAYAKP